MMTVQVEYLNKSFLFTVTYIIVNLVLKWLDDGANWLYFHSILWKLFIVFDLKHYQLVLLLTDW